MRIGPNMGLGIVSSFITMSKQKDEIDFEWLVGKDPNAVTVNWFADGQAIYGRDSVCYVPDAKYNFHDYTIEWTGDHITWLIDGNACKTITRDQWPNMFPNENPNVQWVDQRAFGGIGTLSDGHPGDIQVWHLGRWHGRARNSGVGRR